MIDVVDRVQRGISEEGSEAGQRAVAAIGGGQRVEGARIGETQQDARAVVGGADVEGDEDRTLVGQGLAGTAVGAPERGVVGGVGLAQFSLRPVLCQLLVFGG